MKLKKKKLRRLVVIDEERAKVVFGLLDHAWSNRLGLLDGIVLPQDMYEHLPTDPYVLSHWYFYAVLTQRGGIISEDPMDLLYLVYQHHPDMFNPFAVVKSWTAEMIIETLVASNTNLLNRLEEKSPGAKAVFASRGMEALCSFMGWSDITSVKWGYKLTEHARAWISNSHELVESWQGDIRNVFVGVTDFEQAFARIDTKSPKVKRGLVGMRRKIFSLLVIWLQEKKFIAHFPAPIPVDFQALRILTSTGVIKRSLLMRKVSGPVRYSRHLPWMGRLHIRVSERFVDEIAMWSQKFMVTHGFSHFNVNPALWVLGRLLCAEHFQSRISRKDGSFVDPELLGKGEVRWPTKYKNPCQHCLLQHVCTQVVPSGPYYTDGWIAPLKRLPYPVAELFTVPDFAQTRHFRGVKTSRSRMTYEQRKAIEAARLQHKGLRKVRTVAREALRGLASRQVIKLEI
jgi:hypothetical protein